MLNRFHQFARTWRARLVQGPGWALRRSWIGRGLRLCLARDARIDLGRRSRLDGPGQLTMLEGAYLGLGDNAHCEGMNEIVVDRGASLHIGSQVYVGAFANIRCNRRIYIGDHAMLGQFVSLIGGNYRVGPPGELMTLERFEARDVLIGENAWLGAGVTVLPGRMVGKGAVVGAGAVVTRDVAPYEIVAGNPLRRLGWRGEWSRE